MDNATETELQRVTLDASLVDDELSELLALADEGDSWDDWLAQHSNSGGISPLMPVSRPESVSSFNTEGTSSVTDSESAGDRRADRRRQQNREAMARTRTQKRETLEMLTTQEAALHRILMQILSHKKPIHVDSEARTPLQTYQARVTELVRVREELLMEKQRLTEELRDRSQRTLAMELMVGQNLLSVGKVSSILKVSLPTKSLETQAPDLRPASLFKAVEDPPVMVTAGCWLQFLKDESPLFYQNLKEEDCALIISHNLQVIERVHRALDVHPGVLYTAQCFGWKLERTRETTTAGSQTLLRTRCVKRIPRLRGSAQELQARSWEFLNKPENITRANNGSIKAVVAQHVDEDTVVLLRNSPDKADHKRFRYFSLNTRLWTEAADNSVVVLMIVLDKEAQPRVPFFAGIKWMKQGCACLRFSHVGDEYTQIEYTATIECVSEEHATSVVVANCVALLKWENFVVPPWLLAN